MSDLYQKVANTPLGRSVANALNLPTPVVLERFTRASASFVEGNVLVGAAKSGTATSAMLDILGASAARLYTPNVSSHWLDTTLSEQSKTKLHQIDSAELEESQRFKALVFDATGITTTEGLRALYDFFQPMVRRVGKCGRVVIIGRQPRTCSSPVDAAAQQALEGFVRSIAKEIGKKGATANLMYLQSGAETQLDSPLRFLLSPRSAYVNAQVISVSKASAQRSSFDWNEPLKGKLALVTGASRGIGEAIARVLAREGAKVVCLDIPAAQTALESVASEIGGLSLGVDITAPDAPQQITSFLQAEGGADIVIHNAGITRDKTLGRMPAHFWDMVIDINLSAEERINEALFEANALNKNARIVCVSSIGGIAGNFGQTNYAASKAGVIGYVEVLSRQLKQGMTINAVAPGFIETQMTAAMPLTIREAGRRLNALSQGGQPIDVAEAIAFFASPASQGVNGNIVRVCGQSLIGK
ncbi:MAG: 3-oxoacyl-ACP reductase [Hahellaceae bacterium]|nr:3-oxoacyl-ACP reductase [Hahellaceae bacterium]